MFHPNTDRLVYATVKPHTILILEDVTGKGWQTGQYITTFEEVIPSVKAIAKFHAASVVIERDFNADDRVDDTMLIDYRICSWTTPAVDVHYLLDTIIDQSLKETHRDKIVCLYYEEFCRLLVRLGYIGHIPGLMELQIELLRKGALELFHYITLYPFRFIDRSKINFEELLSGKASNPAAYSETYRRVMKTVLLRFLHQEFENDSAIQLKASCVLRPGTKAGDHFASVMYRTQVQYQMVSGVEKSIDLIMKIKPAMEGLKKELLDSDGDDFFGKEMRMYGSVLPQMAQLLATIGERYEYPRLVYSCKEPHIIIVLEDISAGGWTMKGLVKSYEELKPTIRNIAKFHAASVVIEQMRGDRIVDTVFVDYQMCCWSSQVVDLLYLIYMIPEQTVKDTHRDEIVHYYHQTFSEVLVRLNCVERIPRLIDLQVELLRAGALELFHYIVFSAFRYIDMSTVDPEQFFLGKVKNPAFEMMEFQQTIRKELPRLKYQGII
ncbi:Juvenile hormone-inducible protein [Anopheles darlingi]|uniref:Juvenile hormone-inducible protein n=1 Tax=Anopheles darlingi TaxID=43151 RepID=W5J8G0_ANODA|nr:Juvenile hormone-inducible protein [Anopheles darlingi]